MANIKIDIHNAKGFETVFPKALVDFHTAINFTRNEEDVFKLICDLATECGFDSVIYEYCPDIFADDPQIMMRTNLPKPFEALERSSQKNAPKGYGRQHSLEKWTPTVAGISYADYYKDYPTQVWKYRLASIVTGFKSGFGVALRSPDTATRAGMAFASKLDRCDFEKLFYDHGWTLHSSAWAAHIRILQHAAEANSFGRPLTERQMTYLQLLAEGLLDKQIAHKMNISHSAVRKYQYALSARFEVTKRGDIIRRAIELGILKNPLASQNEPNADWDLKIE